MIFSAFQKRRWSIWIGALCAVTLAHAAIGAALLNFPQDEMDQGSGAPAIEIAIETVSPKLERTDLPMGLESEAAVATQDSSRSAPKVEMSEAILQNPMENDKPDQIIAKEIRENDQRPLPEPEAKIPPSPVESRASAASEAVTALALENAPQARAAASPQIGVDRSAQRIRDVWEKKLCAHLNHHKRYPNDVQTNDVEIQVRFQIDRQGHVISATILRHSGLPEFDEAAIAMVKRADPFPSPPITVSDDSLAFTMPIIFTARHK